jgi:PAS domain S-box-containing protein
MTECSWDVFSLVDSHGAIQYVSPAITRMTGYSVNEYMQMGMNALIHPSDLTYAQTLLAELLHIPGERRTFEIRGRHKDGHWLWLEMVAVNELHNPELKAILVNSRDITERKQAQFELQSTAERYRLLSNSIPDALFVLGLDDVPGPMHLLEVNDRACQLLGYSRAELLQMTLDEIDDPASKTPRARIVEQLRAGEQVSFEQTHITRQGVPIPVEIHARMGIIQGKPVVISLAHNISERKRIEQELRRFEAAVRQTDDAVVITDAPVNGMPTILFANDAFTRITGYTQQEALDQLARNADEHHVDWQAIRVILQRGEVYRGTTSNYHKQGAQLTLQWCITPIVNEQATITHFVATIRDITEQERQFQQLQAVKNDLQVSQEQLNSILNTMEDAVLSLSLPDRQPIYVSSAFERVFGYPLQRFLADPLFFKQIVHPDDLPKALISMQKALTEGFVELEHRLILPDGRVRWLQRQAWVNYDEQGRPLRVNDSARDITARKEVEEALRQSETYLRSLIDSQTAFNIRVDMDGNISYYNNRYAAQFEWIAPSLLGLSALVMILPADHDKVRAAVMRCMVQVSTPVQVEMRKPTRNGDYIWTFWEFIAIQDEQGAVTEIQCVGFDITQQKQVEAALRASEQRYRQMFEMHGLPKLIIDPATGSIVDANLAAGRYYGYDPAHLRTLSIFDVNLSPQAEVKAKMAKAIDVLMLSCEFIHRGADGEPHNVEVFTGLVESAGQELLYSIITDITERERAKTALQEANNLLEERVVERTAELEKVKNRLEAIFNHSGDAILLLDLQNGIQQANETFAVLFALPPADLVGRKLTDFYHPSDALDLDGILAEVACTHQTRHIEGHTIYANGSSANVEISIAPINRSEKAVTSLVCIIRDITERKHAELAIAEERNLLRTLIDVVPAYLYVKDLQHRIVLNNAAHARSLGFDTPISATGKDDFVFFPPAMATKFYTDEEHIFQTGQPLWETEERSFAQDGRETWAMTTKVPLRSIRGELIGLVGITHDISQIKATEEALRQREQQLRASQKMLQLVLDTIPVRVFWKDRDSAYLGCNRLFAEDAGLPQTAKIVGLYDDDLPWLASQASAFQQDDLMVMNSGAAKAAYEETLLTASEKHLVIQTSKLPLCDENNTVIGVLGIYVDITARKEAELALRESEEKFRQFTESAPIAAIITDIDGIIVLVNQQAEKLLGYTRQELIGQFVEMLVPETARHQHLHHRTSYITTSEKRRSSLLELSARRKDGTVFPIDLQLSYIDMKPTPLVMSFLIDRTERQQAEAMLKLALAQEKELGELKSRFVSMASHEFRTPLTAILATTETLTFYREKMNAAQIDSRLDKIRQQVVHMKNIMEDVLQLARIQAGRVEFSPTQGELAQLCQEIIEEYESQAPNRGRIVYTCQTPGVLTDFDTRLMRQVISNLISNALKYSPPEQTVQVDLLQNDAQVVLQVTDRGIGIPAADLPRLFEPFHRAANVGVISGTGLGLSITKQAVDLHSGTITVTSQVDVGTTFTVSLPQVAKK